MLVHAKSAAARSPDGERRGEDRASPALVLLPDHHESETVVSGETRVIGINALGDGDRAGKPGGAGSSTL